MAATWIKPLHIRKDRTIIQSIMERTDYVKNPEKTIAQAITERTDYAKNSDKTEGGELVIGYGCDPRSVDAVCCKGCFHITPLLQHGSHIIRSSLTRHSRRGGASKINRTERVICSVALEYPSYG